MTLNQLNADQLHELKTNYLSQKADERGEFLTWSDMAEVDNLVTMDELVAEYGCTNFTNDDFFCSFEDIIPTDRVTFRKFEDGEVIALFPDMIEDMIQHTCNSYMHIGQHGEASINLLDELEEATPYEYAELAQELRGLGYNLDIVGKEPKPFHVYAGYHELYLTTEPMPEPYVYVVSYKTMADALLSVNKAYDDTIIYCDNVKDYLPATIYEWNQDSNYEYFHIPA